MHKIFGSQEINGSYFDSMPDSLSTYEKQKNNYFFLTLFSINVFQYHQNKLIFWLSLNLPKTTEGQVGRSD